MTNENAASKRDEMMRTTSIPRLVRKLALPAVVSMLVTSFYNLVDTFFVGKISTSATGAVGIIFPMTAIVQAVAMTFALGGASYVSRLLGAGNRDKANRTFSTSFFLALAFSIVIAACGLSFTREIVVLLGATDTIYPYAFDYASIIFIGVPFFSVSFVLNNTLRAEGNATLAMVGISVGVVLNVALDPLFIFTFEMGIAGAALATIISQFVSFVILLMQVMSKRSGLKLSIKLFTFKEMIWWEIVRMGSSAFFRQGLAALSSIALNLCSKPYGDYVIATSSIIGRIMMFCFSIALGIGQGYQPVAGFSYGAREYGRLKEAMKYTIFSALTVAAVESILLFLFAKPIMVLFKGDDPLVVELGTRMLRAHSVAFSVCGLLVPLNMTSQGMGKGWMTLILALLRQGLIYIPILFIMEASFGLDGIVFSQLVADVLLAAVLIIPATMLFKEINRDIREKDEEEKKNERGNEGI